jgi:hypothetical protein
MTKPQQPEIRRSERGETDQDGRRQTREQESSTERSGRTGPVPPENQPGHRPERDQDKPESGTRH